MSLPEYVADASLYQRRGYYRQEVPRPQIAFRPFLAAQKDACAIGGSGGGGGGTGGGGGGVHRPRLCGAGQRCCEPDPRGGCLLCAPRNGQCP
jgi:hypothetical protein